MRRGSYPKLLLRVDALYQPSKMGSPGGLAERSVHRNFEEEDFGPGWAQVEKYMALESSQEGK